MRSCTGDGSSPAGQWNGTPPVCLSEFAKLLVKY